MMLIARSFWLKTAVTTVTAGTVVWLYQVEFPDSRNLFLPIDSASTPTPAAPPSLGAKLPFVATAYCKGVLTSTGVAVQEGIAAADPAVIPVGSVVRVDAGDNRYDGVYTVLDTGPEVRGREVDLYIWSCNEALEFGRKRVVLTLLRQGWSPRAGRPPARLFNRPEASMALPARPLPQQSVEEPLSR